MLLIAALALTQQGIFGQVFKERTGRNGYEEYVMAAELASLPQTSAALYYQPNKEYADQLADRARPAAYKAALRSLLGSTPLQVKRKVLADNRQLLELIRQGNAKPVFSPRAPLTPDTLFPELAGIRSSSRVSVYCAEALLANGQSAEAMRVLLDSMQMAQKIQFETLIANLVGVACQGIVLSSFSDNLDRFSEQDWRLLAQRVPEFLEPNPLIEIVDGEANGALAALDMIINSKERAKEMGQILSDTSNDAFMTKLAEATPAQLQTLRRGLVRNLEEWGKAAKARLQQSEAHWSMPALPAPVTDEEKLFEIIMPSWDQVLATNARMRTQLRLLRLHALIQIYRWHWNALPDKLEQATTEIADPFTGESFVYERQDSGYKLFSRGNALTGEIQLRYRRAVTAGPQDEPPTGL